MCYTMRSLSLKTQCKALDTYYTYVYALAKGKITLNYTYIYMYNILYLNEVKVHCFMQIKILFIIINNSWPEIFSGFKNLPVILLLNLSLSHSISLLQTTISYSMKVGTLGLGTYCTYIANLLPQFFTWR